MANPVVKMEPFVLRGFLAERKWPPMDLWTEDFMRRTFSRDQKPRVRLGKRQKRRGEILHDNKSLNMEFVDFSAMLDWMNGLDDNAKVDQGQNSQEMPPNPNTHWAYLDYRDILELLDEDEAAKVDWAALGVVHRPKTEEEGQETWRDSTVWIGTPGAYTPCHFDTYGFNLHGQIHGHKRWLLFPPGTPLQPTRLPYEESSVFAGLDVLGGPESEEKLAKIVPRAVTLGPGDLLFVPPKWWHSVQCVESGLGPSSSRTGRICVSVNKWFPVASDQRESAMEAVLKFMMALHTKHGLLNAQEHVCLTEQSSMDELEELAEFVQFRLGQFEQNSRGDGHGQNGVGSPNESHGPTDNGTGPSEAKRARTEEAEMPMPSQLDFFYSTFATHPMARKVPTTSWEELKLEAAEEDDEAEKRRKSPSHTAAEQLKLELLEAFSSSEVLDAMLNVLMRRRAEEED